MTEGGALAGLDNWLRAHRWLPDTALAILLAVLLLPASIPLVLDSAASGFFKAAETVALICAQTTVAFRRTLPATAYLSCTAAMAVLVAAPPLEGLQAAGFAGSVPPILLPSSGVYLVLLFSVAAHGSGRMPLLALLIAGLGVGLTTVRLLSAQIVSPFGTGWPLPVVVLGALAAAVLAAWSLGRFRRVRQDYVRSLAERAQQAEADRTLRAQQAADRERTRIAREMHDVVSHSLAVMVAQAEAGRMAAGKDPALGIAVLPTIASTGREALADMRSLLGVLRDQQETHPITNSSERPADRRAGSPPSTRAMNRKPPDPAAPQPRLHDVPALVDRISATGLTVRLQESGQLRHLDATTELTAYRIVQEGLTNVVKHAGSATSVAVQLIWSAQSLTVSIVDDGAPHIDNNTDGDPVRGQGLIGMRERVLAVGGALTTGPTETGFKVVAELPVRTLDETPRSARHS